MAFGPKIDADSKFGRFTMGDPGKKNLPVIEKEPPLTQIEARDLKPVTIKAINKGWGHWVRRMGTLSADKSHGWSLYQTDDQEFAFFGGTHIYRPEKPEDYDRYPHDWRTLTIIREQFHSGGVGAVARLATRAHLFTSEPDSLLATRSSIMKRNAKSLRILDMGAVCLGPDPADPEDRLELVSVNPYRTDDYLDAVNETKLYDLNRETIGAIRLGQETMLAAFAKAEQEGLFTFREG